MRHHRSDVTNCIRLTPASPDEQQLDVDFGLAQRLSYKTADGGEFNWSLQQMPEISLLVFRILRFFLGVRSTAEPPY